MNKEIPVKLTKTGWPKWSIFTLTVRQGLASSLTWGIVFALTIAAQAVAFVAAYPTLADRLKMAASFNTNGGILATFGQTIHLETVAGYTQWKGLGTVVLIVAVLGYLMATKSLRGEEENGRDEIMLAGQTSGTFTGIQKFLGIGVNILILSIIPTVALWVAGHPANVGITLFESLNMGLSIFVTTAMFAAIGGFFSQVFATRSVANFYSMMIFALSYLLRAAADVTQYGWLRNFTPLGWIENFQPMTGGYFINLVPAFLLSVILIVFSIYFAGRRDLNGSILPDKDTAIAKTKLLSSSFSFSLRQSYPALIGWALSLGLAAAFYAGIAKIAINFLNQTPGVSAIGTILSTNQSASIYIGLIFLIFMIAIMFIPAVFLSGVRKEEATGELDSLIVQPVSRAKWLVGKIVIVAIGTIIIGVFCSIIAWLTLKTQGIDLNLLKMFYAGLNLAVPALFLLGVGVLAFAILPRLTSTITYGIIGLSFLIDILASVVKNQHWLLDLSVLHYMNYAPAVDPSWHNNFILIAISVLAAALGVIIFNKRDIMNE